MDLLRAAEENNFKKVQEIIESKKEDISQTNEEVWNALFYAVENFNFPMVKYLIDKRIDINQRDEYKGTPLHLAAGNIPSSDKIDESLKIISLLIDSGIDVNSKDGNENTPLHDWGSSMDDTQGYTVTAVLLISKGADTAAKNLFGDTPGAYVGAPEIWESLLEDWHESVPRVLTRADYCSFYSPKTEEESIELTRQKIDLQEE